MFDLSYGYPDQQQWYSMEDSTILYVTDDPAAADSAAQFLRDTLAVEVTTATGPTPVYSHLNESTPACIVSRETVAGHDGLSLLLRAQLRAPPARTVLFPEHGTERLAAEAVAADVDAYVPGDDAAALADRIESLLSVPPAKQTGRRYQTLFERSDDAVAWVEFTDDGPLIRDANEEFVTTFGPDRGAVIGANIDTLVAPSHEDAAARALSQQVATGESLTRTLTRKTVDGLRRFQWQAIPVEAADDGSTQFAFTVYTDVTQQEEQLERFQAFVEDSPSVLTVLSEDGIVSYQSPSIERILGYQPAEMHGQSIFPYIHPADRDTVRDALKTVQHEESPATIEYRICDADGNWRWFQSRSSGRPESPVVDDIVVNSRDVTKRRRREEDLQTARAFTQSLLAALPDVFVAFTGDQRLLRWNDELVSVVGHDNFEELQFRTLLDATDREAFDQAVSRVTVAGEATTAEVALKNGQDRAVPYRFTLAPVATDDEGTVVVGVGRDISDRLAREQQLRVTNRILRHNVRNRLNIVNGLLTSLREEHPATEPTVEEILATTDRLLRNADNARSINEFVSAGPSTSPRPLKPILARAARTVQARHHDAEIVLEDIDPVTVDAVSIFEESLIELLENAVIHNDATTPRVTVTTGVSDQVAVITVSDNGPGIDPVNAQILTGEVDLDSVTHGSGIGLWQIHWMAEYSDGSITVDTDDGTTVRLRLPRASGAGAADTGTGSQTVD